MKRTALPQRAPATTVTYATPSATTEVTTAHARETVTHHADPHFKPGRIFATPAVVDVLNHTPVSTIDLLSRHVRGDWGNLSKSRHQRNELANEIGLRILSNSILPPRANRLDRHGMEPFVSRRRTPLSTLETNA